MTQPNDEVPPTPAAADQWTTWGQAPEGKSGRSGGRMAAAVLIPVAVLAVLALGVVMFLLTADPAAAAGGCGGG